MGGHVHGSSVAITSGGGVSPRARDDPRPAEAVRGGLPSPLQLHARFSATLRNDSPSFCTPAHTDSLHSRPSSGCTAPRTWPCRGPVVADTGSSACCGRRPQMPQLRVASVLTTPGPTKRRPPSPTAAGQRWAACRCHHGDGTSARLPWDPHGPPRRPVSERPAEGRGTFCVPSRVNMPEPPVTSKREASVPASAENGTCKDVMKVLASTRGSESSVVNTCGHMIATRICLPRGHTHAAVPRGQAWPPAALNFPTSHDRP